MRAKDLKITPAIEDYFQKKLDSLEKCIKNFNEDSVRAEIELCRTTRHHRAGDIFRAEINFSLGGLIFRAEAERDDLFTAIDEARDSIEREIKKFKTKKETIFLRGARSLKKKYGLSPLARFRKK